LAVIFKVIHVSNYKLRMTIPILVGLRFVMGPVLVQA
jgi:hypothetical protein